MKVAVTGASGLIGSALVPHLRSEQHDVLALVRREPRGPDEARWDPGVGFVDERALADVDAVVHLAAPGVGDRRWTDEYKRTLLDARVQGTRTIATALARRDRPTVLVSASGIGWYGDRGDEVLTERSTAGTGFLAGVAQAWEDATAPAREAGVTVALARSGLVMARRGGAFGRLLPLVRLGLAGPLGNGRQWWSWITLQDEVRALTHLLGGSVQGPVNLAAPDPRPQHDVVAALGHELRRPTIVPAPYLALRLVLGQFAEELVGSQRALPAALEASGFVFEHRDLGSAARWTLHAGQLS